MTQPIIFDEINKKQTKTLTEETLKHVGIKIKKLRIDNKLSQLDLAFYTYTEKSFISNLENAKVKNITLLTLLKLSELFCVEIQDLFDKNL